MTHLDNGGRVHTFTEQVASCGEQRRAGSRQGYPIREQDFESTMSVISLPDGDAVLANEFSGRSGKVEVSGGLVQ
ncbi:hypothetical protein ABIF96_003090 [Bradyrhizobium ottawaense]|uniref:hypothetical protein n=1 Tax=Bradyrhizobium ottawaense TaxID=931866 RepID=UPI003832ACEC